MEGKVVLVTGASRGIGRAVAEMLLTRGAKVMINARGSTDEAEWLKHHDSGRVGYVSGDVGKETDCKKIVASAVARFGSLDGVVNNAATTKFVQHKDFDEITTELWNEILSVNVIGAWNIIKYSREDLRKNGGAIVNVASISGITATGSCIPYSVSKAGVIHMTRLLAKTLGPEIRVNAVAPGLVRTAWHEDSEMDWVGYSRSVPLGRYAEAVDIASTVCMLLADSYVTGETIRLDGGRSLG